MGKIDNVIEPAYDLIQTELIGEFLLDRVKEKMLLQKVFQALFGENGDDIWLNEEKNLNTTIVPVIQFKYQSDTFGDRNTTTTGQISGVVIFPIILKGRTDLFRKFGGVLQRWLGSHHGLFDVVPGLVMIGMNSAYQYDRLVNYTGQDFPAMTFSWPYEIDNREFQRMRPEIDLAGPLDADPFEFVSSYTLAIQNEETKQILTSTKTIIPRGSK